MLISTLPDLPGRTFEVRGFVYAHVDFSTVIRSGDRKINKLVPQLIEQAGRLGADAIVDVKTVLSGDVGHCMMTGTAVKLL
jgi:hypothetical protein